MAKCVLFNICNSINLCHLNIIYDCRQGFSHFGELFSIRCTNFLAFADWITVLWVFNLNVSLRFEISGNNLSVGGPEIFWRDTSLSRIHWTRGKSRFLRNFVQRSLMLKRSYREVRENKFFTSWFHEIKEVFYSLKVLKFWQLPGKFNKFVWEVRENKFFWVSFMNFEQFLSKFSCFLNFLKFPHLQTVLYWSKIH